MAVGKGYKPDYEHHNCDILAFVENRLHKIFCRALDFGLATTEDVFLLLDTYVHYFNNRRPAAALGYKSPVQYKTELGF